jgi:hypothetical protein
MIMAKVRDPVDVVAVSGDRSRSAEKVRGGCVVIPCVTCLALVLGRGSARTVLPGF